MGIQAATQARDDEARAALVLQHSLLPADPPAIAGLDLATRYLPADGHLGGDWFDVFALPGRRVGLVMGDVAGHGLRPAIVMGRLRSALRAYALDYRDPAAVLTHLNRKITHFETGAFATCLYGVTKAPFEHIDFSSAGHLPPALARAGRPTVLVDVAPDPPLGARYTATRRTHRVELRPDDALCLYTDGLVETRAPAVRDQHVEGLTALRQAFRAESADAAATRITNTLLRGTPNTDDVALLVARRHPNAMDRTVHSNTVPWATTQTPASD